MADRVGELKAAKSDLDGYLERLKALFVASGRDEAEGVLFRVVLSAAVLSHIRERWWSIDRLIPYAKNARTHTDAHVAAIAASIKEWGWTTPAPVGEDGGLPGYSPPGSSASPRSR